MAKSPLTKIQKRCDGLLQSLVRAKNAHCEACGAKCTVGHHWIEKSRSNYLRYNWKENIIPLCNPCHSKIHNVFGNNVVGGVNVAEIIIKKRGLAWKKRMERLQPTYQKVDLIWLEKVEKELSVL